MLPFQIFAWSGEASSTVRRRPFAPHVFGQNSTPASDRVLALPIRRSRLGKGARFLVASEFPFRRITGVEFASELHDIAVQNVKNYRSSSQLCRDIQCVNGDAMQYVFPDEPTVLFMFNPFRPAVLVPILRRLQASLEQNPRDVLLLYAAPFYGELVEQETMLRCIARERYHNSYGIPRA